MTATELRARAIRAGATPVVWVDPPMYGPPKPDTLWVCPRHPRRLAILLSPRVGRPYAMCSAPNCERYERT